MEDTWPNIDRRYSGSGRRKPVSLLEVFSFGPRRRKSRGRRRNDPGAYVDIYDARSYGAAVSILILSLLDTLLTHSLLIRGIAEEANPIMRAIIESGGFPAFYVAKIVMTTLPVAIILIHKEWSFGRYAARFCLWVYIFLLFWHIFILLQYPG